MSGLLYLYIRIESSNLLPGTALPEQRLALKHRHMGCAANRKHSTFLERRRVRTCAGFAGFAAIQGWRAANVI
jgi:hypothetical protein